MQRTCLWSRGQCLHPDRHFIAILIPWALWSFNSNKMKPQTHTRGWAELILILKTWDLFSASHFLVGNAYPGTSAVPAFRTL